MDQEKGIKQREIVEELETSFIEYAMSVILSRAIPDARDGLKPVHRRILYAMQELGMVNTQPYKKSARVVGEVLAKYHPHGDSSVYEAMVRLAQNFATRYPLVDGQGNFGSIDGDRAAAMRYTEVRLSAIATELFYDLDKETVDFAPNYDGEENEPTVLPTKLPLLIVNGSTGIAVGMATNIPPHNLEEVLDATIYILNKENKDETYELDEITKFIKGPDFPTGAKILGNSGIIDAYRTGKGTVIIQSKAEIKKSKDDKYFIYITEIPYQTEKSSLVEKINELVINKKIDGIAHFHDDSANEEVNIIVEVKKGFKAEVVLNKLFKLTRLQMAYSISMLAVHEQVPKTFNIVEILQTFSAHQKEVLRRKTKYDLRKAEERYHILEGLERAIANINGLVRILRTSKSTAESMKMVKEFLNTSEAQTKAILDMRLQRLTHLETDEILTEMKKLQGLIKEYELILKSKVKANEVIINNLTLIRNKYPSRRRTEIIEGNFKMIDEEDLIPKDDIIVDVTKNGYIRYRKLEQADQKLENIDTDITISITTSTHNFLVAITNLGKAYGFKGYNVPDVNKSQWGLPIQNIINIEKGEYIVSLIDLDDYDEEQQLIIISKTGLIKKAQIGDYAKTSKEAKQVIVFGPSEDEIVSVYPVKPLDHLTLVYNDKQVISFSESKVKPTGPRVSSMQSVRLNQDQSITKVFLCNEEDDQYIIAVSTKGYIKYAKPSHLSSRPNFKVEGQFIALDVFNEEVEGKLVSIFVANNNQVLEIESTKNQFRIELEELEISEDEDIVIHMINDLDEDEEIIEAKVTEETDDENIAEELGNDQDIDVIETTEISMSEDEHEIAEEIHEQAEEQEYNELANEADSFEDDEDDGEIDEIEELDESEED